MAIMIRLVRDRSVATISAAAVAAVAFALIAGAWPSGQTAATDTVAVPASERQWLVEEAPQEQQAALSDLAVARAEYVAAIEAERACVAAQGIWVSEMWWEDNQLRYTFGGVPANQRDDVFAVYRDCHMKHVRNIATAWAMGSAPSTP